MQIDVAQANGTELYRLLSGLVTPRPIAWVSTLSPADKPNLAPFSFYNLFGLNPPIVVFSPLLRRDGSKKDSLRNVEATGEFVINGAVERLQNQINCTAQELPYEDSEFDLAHVTAIASAHVKPPRVAEAPYALECLVRQILPLGTGPLAANLVIGEVVWIHLADNLLDAAGLPDPERVANVGRLGGDDWVRTSDRFILPRPR